MKLEDIFEKLIGPRQNYYENVFGKEDTALQKIRKQAELEGIEYMQLNRGDASVLQLLTQLAQVKKAVEIGGLYGYSTLHIARGPCGFWLCLFTRYGFQKTNSVSTTLENRT